MSKPFGEPPQFYDCPTCGNEIEGGEGHVCECGEEMSKKQCEEGCGFCGQCSWLNGK